MKSRPIKFCCLLITMAMLLQMLPVQVLGAKHTVLESENVAFQEVIQDEFVDISAEDAVVVKEITERRTQFSKEFLLSNGFSMAVVYPEAVHYEEDNTWKEIDNSLKAVGSGANARYVNTAGEWMVSFPQQLSDKKVVTISRDGYTLSFGMAGKLKVSSSPNIAVKSLGRIEDQVETQLTVDSGNLSSAVIEDLDFTMIRESMEHPETFVGSIFSQLKYNNIYDNTDIIYDLNSKGVKESIVIEAYDPNLYGYQYTLNTGTMVPVLEEDGSVALYSPDCSEVVMMMPAPYMIDEAGAISYDVRVTLEAKGSVYTLAYHMPMDWLADDERAWPVVLDPVVEATSNVNNILDQTIMEHYAVSYMSGALHVGYDTSNGKMWTFLEYVDLPQLSSGDVIVNASVSLYRFNGVGSGTTIEVHKVKETWSSSTITWAEKPECDPIVEDYAHVSGTGRYYWEITDIARGWYEGENTGLMFKATDAIESAGAINWQKFYSIDYSKYAVDWWPYLYITYRNNSGLESYWDYTVNGAGRAGTGYVHDYTGNLVWVRDDLGFGGNRMPVSISHIYNADDRDSNNYGMGYGWKTNFNQTVKPVAANINASYVWEDGDGTDHYFVYDSSTGTYKDEDGLELTLATTSDGITITDKYGNTSYFDAAGRLFKQENNQEEPSSIEITYTSSESFLISSIKDGAGRWYYFTYNSSNLLEKITYTGKGSTEITSVTYSYSGEMLSVITDKDGDGTSFGYVGGNLLSQIQDVDGYRLVYTYTEGSPKRVASISEQQWGALGGVLTFSYAHNQTTIQDHNGNVQIMQFNDWGNTICIQDGEGRAQYSQYAMNKYDDTATKQNQLVGSSKMQNTVGNLLYEISFENNLFWWPNATELDVSRTTEDAYLGDYCLKAVTDVENTYFGAFSQSFAIAPGETVTISAYVKNPDAPAHIALHHNDGVIYHTFPGETLPVSNKWVRTEITYTNTFDYVVNACAYLFAPHPGTYYLDCVQAEKASAASRYNLVDNGDFQDGFYAWLDNSGELVTLRSSAAPGLNNTVHKMVGSPDADQHLYHYIYESGSAGDSYVFGCWAKGNAVPLTSDDREFGIRLTFVNTDGSTTDAYASFNTDLPDNGYWQYISAPAVAEKEYSYMIIETVYNKGANTVYFDGIQVFKENFGSSYTYDEHGNVTSVVDLQKQTTTYEYNSQTNDLTRIIQNNKAKVTYEYDTHHNVTKATTETGMVYAFTYDEWGNNTSAAIVHGNWKLASTAQYSADGNALVSITDGYVPEGEPVPLDKTTFYGYNEDTNVLEWVQYPEDTAETRTQYSYDEMYRLASATANVDTGYSLDASYIYADDLLTRIETNSTIYNFTYGNFAQRSSVQIGNRLLASYEYTDDQNRYLEKLTYGNGDTVDYEYDGQGRVTKETFEDGSTVSYEYDNTGALATITDSATGRKTKYYYDLTDRLMKYVESGTDYGHSVEYTYNKRNNLSVMKEITDGRRLDYYYSYDSDNRLWETTVEDYTLPDYTIIGYYYDDHGRLDGMLTEHGSWWGVMKSYTFDSPSGEETSTKVVNYKVEAIDLLLDCDITYDDNGNITSVQSGSSSFTYAYDSANQLIREDNNIANRTWVWTYDNAGNILSRKEYAYTTGSLGPVLDTVNYTYGDDSWGDLLTAYDGVPITYDTIGNPLNDGTWTYTWQNGRELASMSNGTTTWTYTYDANGMRTSRTNGAKTYNYVYNGSQLTQITVGNDTLYFVYDATGAPVIGIWNNSAYYYITSLQGDVIRILDEDGEIVVSYEYDAWGNVIQVGGPMANTLGTLNPLRYRGYVYDVETELYYLQSRYYNPEIGRFINADVFTTTGQGLLGNNMFAYCGNNPVNRIDPTGEAWWHWALGVAVVAVAAVATVVTCGGFAAAATAVCMVGSGVAAATTASTVAAGAFIGSATVYGMAVLSAASTSNSVQEFNDQGNWGTVAATAFGGLTGGYDGYTMSKAQTPTSTPTNTSRGSTGRTEPANLREKLAMEQVKSNPSAGTPLTKITLNDPRWPSSDGWVKMQQIVPTSQGNINIHYVYNQTLKIFDDFKFKP